jgi:hypothetical protein
MYPIDEHDRVIELDGIPKPVTGTPEPIVVADEQAVVVSYMTEYPDPPRDSPTFCSVRFHLAYTHLFGAPNDEALEGHPLWNRGLGHYGVFRVDQSSLIRRLAVMNSVHKRHSYSTFDELAHYIVTFHDSTFECVARSYETVIEKTAWDKRYEKAVELLHRVPPSDMSKSVRTDPLSKLQRRLPSGLRFVIDALRH